MTVVLAIDPGRDKCGYAVLSSEGLVRKGVVSRGEVVSLVRAELSSRGTDLLVVGNGTTSAALVSELESAGVALPVRLLDESHTTLQARRRYFVENPPRGLRRLIPLGLLIPPRPCDDYVAVILAERALADL